MKTKLSLWAFAFSLLACSVAFLSSCKKEDLKMTTTDDVNVVGYLKKNLDSFSLFKEILDRTETSAFLDAYGAYTVFAPTNHGVKTFLASINAPSVEAADINVLKEIVKFHILEDTVNTASFTDGKLPVPTMHGQFLITGVSNDGGFSSYIVNRQANVLRTNVRVGNGLIHVTNNVLVPAKTTIAKQLEDNPEYSIFVEALKATGHFTLLNTVNPDTSKRWKTVIAETNRALSDSGINSYAALRAKYSNTGNPANPLDSLNLYVAYHIIDGIKFLGDIINQPSHLTLQPQEVITVQLINQEVILNTAEFNGVVEPGVLLVRSKSDNSATNGVWHTANAHFAAKFRKPTAVYWDLAKFPEIMRMTAIYGRGTHTFYKNSAADRPIKDIDWEWKGENYLRYEYGTTSTLHNFAVFNDILTIPLGAPSNNNRATWIEFTTPPIIKGRYKVWICYRNRNAVTLNVRVNGELMQRPVNLGQGVPAGTDAELESLGWKRYTTGGSFAGRLVGTVDLQTTQRHSLRFEAISGSNRDLHFDMVHFIPVDDHQYLPRFRPDGTPVF
ncbi:fasciclin domain-containing protein [Aridibaculum aurantiacum]|uniref:fasciclin domain-containing protein n=1 Tax=Aridibaculum aurantiacum TaxID=2810307 RepID=UPI001A968A8E|nr:fasciclin domain-containing protein [Aridibaculum aurantiacum]